MIDLPLIEKARNFLDGKIRKTPIEFSLGLTKLLHHPVYLKLECLQITGSFKVRGALFYLSTLSQEEKKKGIAACSAGNHGLGVSYAARELGIPCTVFVPKNVDQAKHDKIEKLGATVRKSQFIGYDDTLEWAEQEAAKEGLHLISAFDDDKIMAGNGGTLAAEVLDELPNVSNFILPVGGGGLSGGFSYYLKAKNPKARFIACQHIDSPGLKLSLESGIAATKLPGIETVAGGLEGGLGSTCFKVLKDRVDDVILLNEEEIKQGFRWILENHQYLIEPTAAVAIAACLSSKTQVTGSTVVVLPGRNVSYATLKSLIK